MSKSLQLQFAVASGSLESYLSAARNIPILTAEEERELAREGRRFLTAIAFSSIAIALNADLSGGWSLLLPASVFASLIALLFLVLKRSRGFETAMAGAAALCVAAAVMIFLRKLAFLTSATPFIAGGLALTSVFGVGRHIF